LTFCIQPEEEFALPEKKAPKSPKAPKEDKRKTEKKPRTQAMEAAVTKSKGHPGIRPKERVAVFSLQSSGT
jgi:hypothetical protein